MRTPEPRLPAELLAFIGIVRAKIVKQFVDIYPESLECGCAVSSYVLYEALLARNLDASFVQGVYAGDEDHCWVRIGETIVDITACQFSPKLPPVFVTSITDHEYQAHREDQHALEHLNKNWPSEQCPETYLERIERLVLSLPDLHAKAS